MAIEARKILVVDSIENEVPMYKEAVEFYDTNINKNVDPTKTNLTKAQVTQMTNDAFDGK
ncbi:hypothetical protein L8P41_20275 [Enterobacter roggenkampii]|uniref:hypothetical protein n=1 Tax=Enterobacter roggenkampii TaxID=1812935 RepID=UPI0020056D53|nr:hypothetical protein [Enterobacter roggenkampii]MCK7073093.1 hypothetical protein [Enterobacter roggenkampii]MCK7095411.1 hypothetical protein [Enterobacter roggenkampii]